MIEKYNDFVFDKIEMGTIESENQEIGGGGATQAPSAPSIQLTKVYTAKLNKLKATYQSACNGSYSVIVPTSIRAFSNVSWVSPSISNVSTTPSSGSFNITLNVEKNEELEERTAEIYVVGIDPTNGRQILSNTITFTQEASSAEDNVPSFEIQNTNIALGDLGRDFSVPYSGNLIYTIVVTEKPTYVVYKGFDESSINFSISTNTTSSVRTGEIKVFAISSLDGTRIKEYTLTVTQGNSLGSIVISESTVNLPYTSSSGFVSVLVEDVKKETLRLEITIESGATPIGNWYTFTDVSTSDRIEYLVRYKLQENVIPTPRVIRVKINGTSSKDNTTRITGEFSIIQASSPTILSFPIWQDTDYEITSDSDYSDYNITFDNNIIYNGRCYSINGTKHIRLNDILKNYINQQLIFDNSVIDTKGYVQFELHVDNGEDALLRVWNDWSYEELIKGDLSHPAQNIVDMRQYFVASVLNRHGQFPSTVLLNKYMYTFKETLGCIVRYVPTITDADYFYYNTTRFNITCNHRYCLYYRNIWGGYDWLLFNEASKQSDTFAPLSYRVRSNNTDTLWREKIVYENAITEKIALKTDLFFNNEKSELVALALRSTECYLQDLEKGWIKPCVISDTTVEHKTLVGNGRKPLQYTVNVELSQIKLMR